ncbi:hypothetical protein [Pseudomonas putida]|uniref:hypothetical protein n=1 Tax=Pseudomonas putida TaxID=303 RepID=UPI002B24B9FD|nr:hypothetical protein [Pseudomonas putida]
MAIPHWDDAPKWAEWLAQDEDGNWHWFESEPEENSSRSKLGFWLGLGRCKWSRKTPNYRNWHETLTDRPPQREKH